jgi:8-oxo-dGTP pyrophosphatase MutT (NUDIX family)
MMKRTIRYQAAIIRDHHLLLLKVYDRASGQSFWVIPGGGREGDESEEACLRREVREETYLDVRVDRLLMEESSLPDDMYQQLKTYLCQIIKGEPKPGFEPEIDTPEQPTIIEVGWFDLRNPALWDPLALNDPITYPFLQRLRSALGYGDRV